MGYMELGSSLGLTLGPVLASLLYHYFGYRYSFYICAIIILSCIPFFNYIKVEEEECEPIDFFKVLMNPVKIYFNTYNFISVYIYLFILLFLFFY
jgi:MFS family permease